MGLFKKGSKPYSIFEMKCPRCHEGDLFETGSFSFQKSFDMPERCPKCDQAYFLGPGFYYGAMFISYVITAFYALIFCGILILVFGVFWKTAFFMMLVSMAILFVWFFRLARAVWINFNVSYDPKAIGKK